MQIKDLAVKKIKVGERWQTPDKVEIQSLADSMKEVGLLEPIGVNKKGVELIYGLTRLEAAKLLGWKTITSIVLDVDALTAQLMELYENLKRRKPGTALEEAETMKRVKELYEQLYPQTRHGGDHGNQYTGGKSALCALATFSADMADKTGKSRATVDRTVAIAESITEKAADAIRDTPLADCKSELTKLGKLPEKEQVAVAKAIRDGKAETVAEAVKAIEPKPKGRADEILDRMKSDNAQIEAIARKITGCFSEIETLDLPHINETCVQGIFKSKLKEAAEVIRAQKGKGVCPYCEGKWCKRCHKTGYLPQVEFDSAPKKG